MHFHMHVWAEAAAAAGAGEEAAGRADNSLIGRFLSQPSLSLCRQGSKSLAVAAQFILT